MPSPNPADFAAEPALHAGDIFFARNESLGSRLTRLVTRRIGEPRSWCDHVGVVVRGGPFGEAVVVEALHAPKRRRLVKGYAGPNARVAVFRPTNLPDEERRLIIHAAQAYVGRKYTFTRRMAHTLDWLLQGSYVFRRLVGAANYPICSWVVAHSFSKAGRHFGVTPGYATPDDIWHFVTEETDKYECVRELAPLNGGEELP